MNPIMNLCRECKRTIQYNVKRIYFKCCKVFAHYYYCAKPRWYSIYDPCPECQHFAKLSGIPRGNCRRCGQMIPGDQSRNFGHCYVCRHHRCLEFFKAQCPQCKGNYIKYPNTKKSLSLPYIINAARSAPIFYSAENPILNKYLGNIRPENYIWPNRIIKPDFLQNSSLHSSTSPTFINPDYNSGLQRNFILLAQNTKVFIVLLCK